MRARCYRCQSTFDTDHFGIQTCPSCGAEVYLPDPGTPAPTGAPPEPAAAQPERSPGEPTPPPLPAPPSSGPGWGAPQGWSPPGQPPGSAPSAWSPVAPGALPPVTEQSSPFAERAQRGFVGSFIETWRLAAFEPVRFFRQVRIGETRSAVLFGVIALTLGNWAALVFSYLTASATMGFFAQFTRRMKGRIDTAPLLEMVQGLTAGSFVAQLVATPLLAFVGLYLTAAVFHVLLLVVRGAPRGFDATLTVVGYASGLFLIRAVPACGGLIAGVWFMVAAIHGLAESQRSGTAKSAFAVLMPLVLACALACAAGAIAGMAGLSGLKGSGGPPPSTGI
jgi:hypothetical protein